MAKKQTKKTEGNTDSTPAKNPKGELRGWRVWNPKQTAEVQSYKVAGRLYHFFKRNGPSGNMEGNLFSDDELMKPTIDYFVNELGFKKEEFRR